MDDFDRQKGAIIAEIVVDLPRYIAKHRDVSPFEFVSRSGYFQSPELVTELAILDALNRKPQLIERWLEYSASQRIPSGWYIQRTGEDSARVAFFTGKSDKQLRRFKCLSRAVAYYVNRELEGIRSAR